MYKLQIDVNGQAYELDIDTQEPLDEKKIRQIIFEAQKKKLLPLPTEIEKPSKFVQKIAETKIPERTALFTSHFAPILNIFLREDEREYLKELEQEYPSSVILGEIAGSIPELTVAGIGVSKATKFLPKLLETKPRLARFLTAGIRSGLTFAGQGLFRESVRQVAEKEFNPEKLGKSAGENFVFGLGLGMGEKISSIPLRTLASSLYAGAFAGLSSYIKEKKINPMDVAINTAVVGTFTALTGKRTSEQIRNEIYQGLYNAIYNRIKTAKPDISPEVVDKATKDFVNVYVSEIYKRAGRVPTDKEVEDFTARIIKTWQEKVEPKTGVKSPFDTTIVKTTTKALVPIQQPTQPKQQPKPPKTTQPTIEQKSKPISLPETLEVKPEPVKPVATEEIKPVETVKPQEQVKLQETVKPQEVKPVEQITEPVKPEIPEPTKITTQEIKPEPIQQPKTKVKPTIEIPKELQPLSEIAKTYDNAGDFAKDIALIKSFSKEQLQRKIQENPEVFKPSLLKLKEVFTEAEKSFKEGVIKDFNITDFYNASIGYKQPKIVETIKPKQEITQPIQEATIPQQPLTIPQELQPLVEFIPKFKSNDEFIKTVNLVKNTPLSQLKKKIEQNPKKYLSWLIDFKKTYTQTSKYFTKSPEVNINNFYNIVKRQIKQVKQKPTTPQEITPPQAKPQPASSIDTLYQEAMLVKKKPETLQSIDFFSNWLLERGVDNTTAGKMAEIVYSLPEEKWTPTIRTFYSNYINEAIAETTKRVGRFNVPKEWDYFKGDTGQNIPIEGQVPSRGIFDAKQALLLTTHIIDKFPDVGRLRKSLGVYIPDEKRIVLNSEIFKNFPASLHVLLHETGHAINRILVPEKSNILGQLAGVNQFLHKIYKDIPISTVLQEAEAVITKFLGKERWDIIKKSSTPSREIYADLFSLMIINPPRLNELAPNCSKLFWEGINKNKEIAKVINNILLLDSPEIDKRIMELLRIGFSEHISEEDLINIIKLWNKVENINLAQLVRNITEKNAEIKQQQQKELLKEQEKQITTYIQSFLIDNWTPLQKILKQKYKKGLVSRETYYDMLNTMSQFTTTPANLLLYTTREFSNIVNKYLEAGYFTIDDLSSYLITKRIANPEDVANPLGITYKDTDRFLQLLKERLGTNNFEKLQQCGQEIKQLVDKIVLESKDNGILTADEIKEWISGERHYIPFTIEKYSEEAIKPFFRERKGTLKPVKKPLYNLIVKMALLREYALRNQYKIKLFDTLLKDIPEVKSVNASPYHKPKPPEGFDVFEFVRNGHRERYFVPQIYTECFKGLHSFESNIFAMGIHAITSALKDIFTRKNPSFIFIANIIRDFGEALTLGKTVSSEKLYKSYSDAKRIVNDWLNGKISPEIEQLIKDGILSEGMFGKITDIANIKQFKSEVDKRILSEVYKEYNHNKIIRWLDDFIEKIEKKGTFTEKIHKVAGYFMLKDDITSQALSKAEAIRRVRELYGSPDFDRVARGKLAIETFIPFYNAQKEGMRRLFTVMKTPGLRRDFWLKVSSVVGGMVVLRTMAEEGAFDTQDKPMSLWYLDMPLYYKSYYPICFPVGETKTGDLVIFRLPVPESVGMFYSFFYALTKSAVDIKKQQPFTGKRFQRHFTQVSQKQMPSINPIIETIIGSTKSFKQERTPGAFIKEKAIIVGEKIGDNFNIKTMEWIFDDIIEGRDLKVAVPLRMPFIARLFKVISPEQRINNRMKNLGL